MGSHKRASIQKDHPEPAPFRKAPVKDARELGLANKSKSVEPAGIAAISEQKRKIKSAFLNHAGERKYIDTNYLIDKAFDQLHDTGKAVVKAGKAVVKEGFHGAKTGIRAINEISDEVVKNPMLIRMGQVNDNNMRGMASQHRHALNSIAAVGNNRRNVSAGSLVKQHGIATRTTTNTTNTTNYANPATSSSNPYGITAKFERGLGGRVELHYYYTGQRVTHQQVERVLTQKQVHQLKTEAKNAILGYTQPVLTNNASTTTEQAYSGNNPDTITKKPVSASGLVTRHNNGFGTTQTTTNPVLNKTKTASPSGLVTRNHGGLGTDQSNVNTVGNGEHNPVGVITKTASPSGLVTRAKNGTGATKMSHNPVLNIAKIASPSRLMRRTHSGVV